MSFCRNCGKELDDGARFCRYCGTPKVDGTERKTVNDGELHKCPNCGEVLKAFETVCPACGVELRGTKSSSAVNQLAEKIEKAADEKQRIIIIKSFIVPNTREDIFEFMLLAASNFDAEYYASHLYVEDISDAWLAKVEQCYQKARFALENSEDMKKIQDIYDKIILDCEKSKKTETQKSKKIPTKSKLIFGAVVIGILIFAGIFIGIKTSIDKDNAKNEELVAKIEELIDAGKYSEARIKANQISHSSKWALVKTSLLDEIEEKEVLDIISEIEELLEENYFSKARDKANQIPGTIKWAVQKNEILSKIAEKENIALGKIKIGLSQEDFHERNYLEVKELLEDRGFTNIKLDPIKDLTTGWIVDNGSIEEVLVNGSLTFDPDSYTMPDIEIIIRYHTFKK